MEAFSQGIEVLDGHNEANHKQLGPTLMHFRSTTMASYLNYVTHFIADSFHSTVIRRVLFGEAVRRQNVLTERVKVDSSDD